MSDQPFLLGILAEGIWSGWQTHKGLSKLWLVSRFWPRPHGALEDPEEVVLVTFFAAQGGLRAMSEIGPLVRGALLVQYSNG